MLAVYGVLLLASSTLLFIWAYGQFRCATPKKWTTSGSLSNIVVLTIISLFSFGMSAIIKALMRFASSPISLAQAAMIGAIVVVSIVVGRALRRRAAPYMSVLPADILVAQAGVASLAVAANDPGPGNKPRPVSGSGRRRAA